jgi:cytochrome c5
VTALTSQSAIKCLVRLIVAASLLLIGQILSAGQAPAAQAPAAQPPAAQPPAAQPPAPAQAQSQPEPGERLVTALCTTCHDTRPVETQALDEAGWTKEVKAMIEKGADVKDADLPVLVDYLTRYHGPLPDGPGKEVLLNVCTQCHDLQRVRRERRNAEGWSEILLAMLNEGAPLNEADFATVLRYLARNFR